MSQDAKQPPAIAEPAEPTAGQSFVPIWMVLALGALFFWAASFLDKHAGAFNPMVYEPYTSYEEVSKAMPSNPEAKFMAMGEATFNKSCALCHQPNGMGKEGQFPPLAGSDWLLAAGPNRIGRIVLHGLTGPIVVNTPRGPVSLNATMAPLGDNYTDEELAAALSYVRKQWGNNADKISPGDIKALRAATASHPGPFVPADLMKMPMTMEPPAK
jgi:mono/diheme cytochrome c family protein